MIKTFKVKVNKKEFEVEVEELKKAPECVVVDTKTVNVKAEAKPVEKEVKEEKPVVAVPKVTKPAVEEKKAGKHDVVAPLPGVVVEILVKKGKKVKENEPVVVLEAMKMENSLLAPVSGTVEEIHVNVNQAVNGNCPLITITG